MVYEAKILSKVMLCVEKNDENWIKHQRASSRTRAIITRGLYIFYPIFEGDFSVSKAVFLQNYFMMYG